ncbi:hypothetical protein PVAND_016808 [Polypedilum vanderplanki]|uniref:Ionotropic receptor n=1 Tax=Polypedilum vanderplanki TaxID=319348 RepID=A0A9J6BGV7_POLVA|nr:hypothetical protein PVAND_016808 [Polypedilum vanderplanki]
MKQFKIFSLLFIFISILQQIDSFQNLIVQKNSNLSKFFCRAIFDLKRKNSNAKFVAIGTTMENYFEKNLIDEISYCLSKNEMAKINFDFRENFVDKIKAVNAELVILIADKIDTVTFYHFVRRRSNNSSLSMNFMSKFLIVTSNSENANSLTSTMETLYIFNFAIVYEDFDGETTVLTANFFFNKTKIHKRIKREEIMTTIFPDKLKNLNGYNFRVFISQLFAHTEKSTGEIFSKYLYFIQEISKIKNAEINLTVWSTKDSNLIIQEIEKILINKNFDLLIFDILKIDSYDSRLDVYEQNGLCFIVPSTRTILENFEIFLGFIGGNQKFFVVISSVLIIFIWSLYRKRGANNSVTKTALYLWASAYDKTLKLRNNRLVLTVMLQLFVIAMLFYNLIFNAVFTSIMTVSTAEMKYKSITELIDNNEKFTMDGFVSYYLKDGNEYKKLEAEDRIKIERHVTYFANDFGDRIIISQCNFVQMYEKMNNWSPDSYYVLPEKILSHYTQLEV